MSASQVMLIGFALLVVAHWANNQPSVSGKLVIEMAAAILIVAMLDHGETAPIASGLAWLFLVAVLLSDKSPLNVLKRLNAKSQTTDKPVLV